MDRAKIHLELSKLNYDWINFKFNVPAASHMGRIWERQFERSGTSLVCLRRMEPALTINRPKLFFARKKPLSTVE